MILSIDIETVPTAAALALPYPTDREPPASYSKPESIAAWRQKDRAEWEVDRIKQYSLNPLYGRVVACGFAISYEDGVRTDTQGAWMAVAEAAEATLLKELWVAVDESDVVVTWNGHGFDLPFLLTRSALQSVPTPRVNLLKRYTHAPHCDVKQAVCNWDSSRIRGAGNSLDDWARAFGLGGKVAHGSAVYGMYVNGDFDAIEAYAGDDAGKTLALYHKVAPTFIW